MNKPEKKENKTLSDCLHKNIVFNDGYNQACDDWEKWTKEQGNTADTISLHYATVIERLRLSEEEVAKLIYKEMPVPKFRPGYGDGTDECCHEANAQRVAKAICELQRGKE